MESRVRVLGHPVHPMLVVFPLGLLVTAVVFDVIYLITGNASFAQVAFWDIAAGLVGAVVAALTGLLDWLIVPRESRARRIGMWHGLSNAVVVVLFALAWLYRLNEPTHAVEPLWLVIQLVAVSIGGVAGWLGGELVDRLGVGVSADANVNAPNSLRAT